MGYSTDRNKNGTPNDPNYLAMSEEEQKAARYNETARRNADLILINILNNLVEQSVILDSTCFDEDEEEDEEGVFGRDSEVYSNNELYESMRSVNPMSDEL